MRELVRYLEPRPRGRLVLWGGSLALLLAAAGLGIAAGQAYTDAAAATESAERLRIALRPKPVPQPSRSEQEMARRWASLESERAFAWYPIFLAIEQASSDDIELLEFSPDKAGRRLVLRGEARDLAALFRYVEALSSQQPFYQVYLAQQKHLTTGALKTVSFEVRMQIVPQSHQQLSQPKSDQSK